MIHALYLAGLLAAAPFVIVWCVLIFVAQVIVATIDCFVVLPIEAWRVRRPFRKWRRGR